jgi:hypothetical protein
LKDFVVVADSGLMNNENIALLEQKKYKYIIGARIKNENKSVTQWILSLEKEDGKLYEYHKTATSRLDFLKNTLSVQKLIVPLQKFITAK